MFKKIISNQKGVSHETVKPQSKEFQRNKRI